MAGIIVKKCPCLRPKIEEEVKVLDYRHSSLHDVPSEVFNRERTLEVLYCDSNQIRDLPRELFYCHGLRHLSISDNEITNIPPAISSLGNLEELDFSKNGIIDVPESIKGCKYLRSIDASVNPLGKLPEGFTQLSNLTHLFLNDTFLDYLPGSFGRMVKLRILEMRENHLKTLPKSFGRLTDLERLDIGNNEFTELSDVIGELTSLLELWCDNNQIATITHTIGNLKQLMFLDASKNQLQDLPGEIEGCVALADLHLTSNNLMCLPDSIGNLNHLTTLKADDNQLTSLPKTLGGLSSLSELNVSMNDLEDLPASIGLLRNLRTFYADDNMLKYLPAELGSCSGITVLSMRSNKLTYIPDELGRIPRLRVLNLSDNYLRYLPFTIIKLKELQALWLTENQTRPLIPLQSETEPGTGRKILTCYLLPQGASEPNDERDPTGDTESFHASMWDEERLLRQQIHFDFVDDSDEEGTLVRCPTPYPKEMREKVRHARNLAMRQMMNSGENSVEVDTGARDSVDHTGRLSGGFDEAAYGFVRGQSDVRMREARITKPVSPKLQESHRLFRFDKEKIMKDKARMQHRLSVPDFEGEMNKLIIEQKIKDRKVSADSSITKRSGSVPDLTGSKNKEGYSAGTLPAANYEDLYYKQIVHRHRGRRSRRMREYDSDTGYRSDKEIRYRDADSRGANSEILSVRSQPLPSHHFHHQQNGRRKDGAGYASDLEAYSAAGSLFPTANAAAAAFQQKLGQRPSASTSNKPDNSPAWRPSKNIRPQSPSRSEPRHVGSRTNSFHPSHYRRTSNPKEAIPSLDRESVRASKHNVSHDSNSTASNDEFYKQFPGNEYYPAANVKGNNSNEKLYNDDYFISGQPQTSFKDTNSGGPSKVQLKVGPQIQSPGPPSQRLLGSGPPVAPKPNLGSLSGSNQSLQHAPSPSPPVFSKDSFLDQSTPVSNPAPLLGATAAANISTRERRGSNLYTVIEERGTAQKILTSQTSQGSAANTPPPYNPAPPYRRPSDSRTPGPRTERLSSDSSSSRVDSPHTTSSAATAMILATASGGPSVPRSQSSPCGFHGNNPFPELPATPREKLSYSDYADLDRRNQGRCHVRDNQTTRSGSSSSHIGSASQIGHSYHSGARARDRSDSSDSHRSSIRESPNTTNRHEKTFDQYSGPMEAANYEDFTMIPNQEQSSQVSSSTDSGYGPGGHHVYERIGEYARSKAEGYSLRGSPGSHSSGATSTPPSQRMTPVKNSGNSLSRDATPSKDYMKPDSTTQEHREQFRVTIKKSPGLGFSIAGGIGSHGNPYRANDIGIFVTKVTADGPASKHLRPGDKLLEVNKVDFQAIEHNQAVAVLKTNHTVNLLIERIQKVNMV
uniref:PDZ domain-containing protein n=1 Tax=Biomphalaria glabrata TaxID=6526 RepID=A0A2C9JVF7_BIOGL